MFFDSPVGLLEIEADAGGLRRLSFRARRARRAPPAPAAAAMEERVARELRRYFEDSSWRFRFPLNLDGASGFQRRVWRALSATGAGQTLTYGGLAARLGTHPRAVGGACRSNPLPIVIPCHRVVAKSGGLRGYTGPTRRRGLAVKAWLLRHEGADAGFSAQKD